MFGPSGTAVTAWKSWMASNTLELDISLQVEGCIWASSLQRSELINASSFNLLAHAKDSRPANFLIHGLLVLLNLGRQNSFRLLLGDSGQAELSFCRK